MANYNPYGKTNTEDIEKKFGYKQPTAGSIFSNAAIAIPLLGAVKVTNTLWKAVNLISKHKSASKIETGKRLTDNAESLAKSKRNMDLISKKRTNELKSKWGPNKGKIHPKNVKEYDSLQKTLQKTKDMITKKTNEVDRMHINHMLNYNKNVKWGVIKKNTGSVVGDVLGSYAAYKYVDGKISNGK